MAGWRCDAVWAGGRTSLRESWDVGRGVEGVEGRDEGVVVWWVGVGIGFGAYKEVRARDGGCLFYNKTLMGISQG